VNDERYDDQFWSGQIVRGVPATYADDAPVLNGFEIINHCFDHALRRDPSIIIFGEDVGSSATSTGAAPACRKNTALRVSDTGIRECTIAGGDRRRGASVRSPRSSISTTCYALQILSDDLATTR
jgi:hypothetical protein